jgi:predicted amidohydrolase YtcJ
MYFYKKIRAMRYYLFLFTSILLSSCYKGESVDLIIHNADIHVMNDAMDKAEAIAIRNGKIIEVGPERQILNKYSAEKVINAEQKDIFPGLHDAHGHIMSLAKQRQHVDLRGVNSYDEMIRRVQKHQEKNNQKIIQGRGWDQSLWGEKNLPSHEKLSTAFPNTPLALTRIDGHAMIVNSAMMDFANINDTLEIQGGVINTTKGILLDFALDYVNKQLPKPNKENLKKSILDIQDELLAFGITHVHEAGLHRNELSIFQELAKNNKLKIQVYAMLFPTEENFSFAESEGFYREGNLSVRSFKVIVDGSLGSHGACLLQPYADSATYGIMLQKPSEVQNIFKRAKSLDYQLNSHCIGDSANRVVLETIDTLMNDVADHRWRIEHAQVINPNDFKLFESSRALPSVQPTHATTDQRWAQEHLGEGRLKASGYAYNSLHEASGMIMFGTDFPVEDFDPFATLYAATKRKNKNNEPDGGFLINEKVTYTVALKAMTLWAAFGCFEESQLGSLEKGKDATLTILDQPIEQKGDYKPNYATLTLIKGEPVYDINLEW